MPKSTFPQGRLILVIAALITTNGIAAGNTNRGFCHCFKPLELELFLSIRASSTNPINVIRTIVVIAPNKIKENELSL